MTACVDNKEKKGGAAKAVSATLAGVLAVGMVPAVAFATPDGGTENADEIGLLSTSDLTSWVNGKATSAVDADGNVVNLNEPVEFVADTTAQYITPTAFLPDGDATPTSLLNVDGTQNARYTIDYYKAVLNADQTINVDKTMAGAKLAASQVTGVGTYVVTVTDTQGVNDKGATEPAVCKVAATFKILPRDLTGVVYEVDASNPSDVSDETFTFDNTTYGFTGAAHTLNLKIDGVALTYNKHYTVETYSLVGGTLDNTLPTHAGTYNVKFKGEGVYEGEDFETTFTIDPLSLSEATIVAGEGGCVTNAQSVVDNKSLIKVNGTDANELGLDVSVVSGTNGTHTIQTWDKNAATGYTYQIKVADSANLVNGILAGDITGEKTITVVAAQDVAGIGYNGAAFSTYTKASPLLVDLSGETGVEKFDTKLVTAYYTDTVTNDQVALTSPEGYTLTVTNAAGSTVTVDQMNTTPGWYQVNVAVNHEALNYAAAGNATMWAHVIGGTITADTDVVVAYEGKVTDSITDTYDGTDVLDDTTITVRDGEKTLVEGTDYVVGYYTQVGDNADITTTTQWTPVTEMVDAGEYIIAVFEAGYDITGGQNTAAINNAAVDVIPVTIKPVEATQLRFAPSMFVERDVNNDGTGERVVKYAGSAIEPVIEYYAGKDANNNDVWKTLPADSYKIANLVWLNQEFNGDIAEGANLSFDKTPVKGRWEAVDSIQEPGYYRFQVEDVASEGNYTVTAWTFGNGYDNGKVNKNDVLYVSDEDVFSDVLEGEWYTSYVYDAATAGYMGSYSGTDLFGPHDNLLRGQAATVLFRMAGGIGHEWDTGFGDASLIFDDVAAKVYYSTPIAWAEQTGIVTGYEDGSNEFRPDNSITREEFCTMLYRYAQKTNQLGDETEADLSAYPDADMISTWAQDAVEWAVANEIFGGDVVLRPNASISRAEVAKMIVTLQEKPLESPAIG